MTYESWRISYQSSEAAARSAWQEMIRLHHRVNELEAQLSATQPAAQGFRDGATAPAQPVAEPAKADSVLEDALSDAVRVPLDSLHADAAYLCGRLLNGSLTQEQVVESIRRRIDAAKAAIRARASHGQAPAQPVAREPLTDEQIQDLLLCGNPTDEEMRLIRIGWDAAHGIKGGQHGTE